MKPAVVWIGIVVGLLSMSVIIQLVGVILAVNDPSFALEPDYERKAAEWDERKEQRRRSEVLGWETSLRTTPSTTKGMVDVELTLVDSEGTPISDALVSFDAFHNARASQILRDELPHQQDGNYRKTLPLRRSGVWEFRLDITRGNDRFLETTRKSVVSPRRTTTGRS